MMKISHDVVKRWVNEAQEAASSDNIMVQVPPSSHTGSWDQISLTLHLRGNVLAPQMCIS